MVSIRVPLPTSKKRAVGSTTFDDAEAAPVPAALVALTVKVYALPLVKPDTMMGLPVPEAARLPYDEVTV
jgi:hypothetical protein